MHQVSRLVMGLPRQGTMRNGQVPLTLSQRAMVAAAGPYHSRC